MAAQRDLHLLLPDGVDDPARPSGGNVYDRRVSAGLAGLGWTVHEHLVAPGALDAALAQVPAGGTVLLDGLLLRTSGAPAPAAGSRLHVLVHMPWGRVFPEVRDRERATLTDAAGVIVTSGWTRDWLLDEYALAATRVHVATPGVDPAPAAPGTSGGTNLLSVGALIAGKGHDVLVAALSRLRTRDWTCTVVGSGEVDPGFAGLLRRLVTHSGLDGQVVFTGPLPAADLAEQYAAADLLVVPSRLETYGMVVTEALARGIPVVASDVGGLPEALGVDDVLAGTLVAAEDPDALAFVLGGWLGDEELRQRWRRRAAARRTGLTGWDVTARQVATALQPPGG